MSSNEENNVATEVKEELSLTEAISMYKVNKENAEVLLRDILDTSLYLDMLVTRMSKDSTLNKYMNKIKLEIDIELDLGCDLGDRDTFGILENRVSSNTPIEPIKED